jgi:zinc D-Ala-D-Ala carboxypeptidase
MNYFSENELRCKCGCGEYYFNSGTLARLNKLRIEYNKPIPISSGFRCESYNIQKGYTQTHASGQAVDILISRKESYRLLKLAFLYGFTGIGIKQHGENRFIHLDDLPELETRPRPTIWSYK